MTRERQGLGRAGEELAARYLRERGYAILDQNWRYPGLGELDLVAQDASCLVLVEVRTRRGQTFGSAEDSVTPAKQARLVALAEAYQAEAQWNGPVRIDVIAVTMSAGGRLLAVNHLKNAVSA